NDIGGTLRLGSHGLTTPVANSVRHELLRINSLRTVLATLFITRPHYCSICGSLFLSRGFFCHACGVAAEGSCLKKANRNLPCKAVSAPVDSPLKHHWTKGNLPLDSVCDVCDEDCGNGPGLVDFICAWCQRTVHQTKYDTFFFGLFRFVIPPPDFALGELCDLGPHRRYVVPPNAVILRKRGRIRRQNSIIERIVPPENLKNWSPLIVIRLVFDSCVVFPSLLPAASSSSGNMDGHHVLNSFRRVLHTSQVIDLARTPPEEALEWCHLLPQCVVMVAGGDGSISWVLNTIHRLRIDPPPPVALLPLGTGNDLSRILGWGPSQDACVDAKNWILQNLPHTVRVPLDRWRITIAYRRHPLVSSLRSGTTVKFMNNYASVGVDALVALNFHRSRNRSWYFPSRIFNKFLYLSYGTKDVLERECRHLSEHIRLELDGEAVELPPLEGVVFLNINCWCAGVTPWISGVGHEEFLSPSPSDGLIEVFGIRSSFHIAQMQVRLSEPLRLGQVRTAKVTLLQPAPMQVDGEPWEQPPGEVTLAFDHQATMLSKELKPSHSQGDLLRAPLRPLEEPDLPAPILRHRRHQSF
ncbi:unnamed protein product, partial [Cyprideis torosa]